MIFSKFLGKNKVGGIKPKNEIVHAINWDCVVFDEYHYGAWRERAKELFENEEKDENNFSIGEGMDYFDEDALPITTSHYLYLSGTPLELFQQVNLLKIKYLIGHIQMNKERKKIGKVKIILMNQCLRWF